MHSLVAAEIALVSLRNRRQILEELDQMDRVTVAQLSEVRRMVEDRALFSRGIGLTDAHLVASCLLTRGTDLWTKDILLQKVAESLGIRALI